MSLTTATAYEQAKKNIQDQTRTKEEAIDKENEEVEDRLTSAYDNALKSGEAQVFSLFGEDNTRMMVTVDKIDESEGINAIPNYSFHTTVNPNERIDGRNKETVKDAFQSVMTKLLWHKKPVMISDRQNGVSVLVTPKHMKDQ